MNERDRKAIKRWTRILIDNPPGAVVFTCPPSLDQKSDVTLYRKAESGEYERFNWPFTEPYFRTLLPRGVAVECVRSRSDVITYTPKWPGKPIDLTHVRETVDETFREFPQPERAVPS